MTPEEAALLVSELEKAVVKHLPGHGNSIHVLRDLKAAFEQKALEDTEGEQGVTILGNVETGEVFPSFDPRDWRNAGIEWMDDAPGDDILRIEDGKEVEGDSQGNA